MATSGSAGAQRRVDCVVVGAGVSGLYAIHRLAKSGLSVRAFEAAPDVGGVWYWNGYPGAAVDVMSRDYSYSFDDELQREWKWTRRFAGQPEIQAYLSHVADRFDLRSRIAFETRVVSAHFDETAGAWRIATDKGEELLATYLVMTCGHLSTPNIPDFPGIERFEGEIYHTGRWPKHPVDFAGKKVAVIGTGSSGVQVVPKIAPQVDRLYVLQRTAPFTLPINNGAVDDTEEEQLRQNYPAYRRHIRENYPAGYFMHGSLGGSALAMAPDERDSVYEELWGKGGPGFLRFSFNDIMLKLEANETAADFVRRKIASIVEDPETADKLTPRGYPIGTRRIALDDGYFQTYNRPNVELVDVKESPIEAITETGVKLGGRDIDLDMIIMATGYDAFTGTLFRIDIRGRDGIAFKDKWKTAPLNYLGVMVSDFPNMFIVQGPGSPSVFANVLSASEEQINWIANFIDHARAEGVGRIECDPAAEQAWVENCNRLVQGTLFTLADSWWSGGNIPGKPKLFYAYVGGLPTYRQTCADEAEGGYPGFRLSA
jgi:cyclohexanone monooxygenase